MIKHRRFWTAAELDILRELYPDTPTAQLAERFGRSVGQVYQAAARYGLRKSDAYLASPAACRMRRGDQVGWAHRFAPGAEPWNKGLKGSTGHHPRSKATQFRPGTLNGRAAQHVVPVGSYRVNDDGYLDRKVSDQPGPQTLRWRAVHRLVWEAAHGHVPAGHAVVFRPGRRTTDPDLITLDALELVTRAELMRRNSVHIRCPPELARVVQLRGALQRQINRRAKEAAE